MKIITRVYEALLEYRLHLKKVDSFYFEMIQTLIEKTITEPSYEFIEVTVFSQGRGGIHPRLPWVDLADPITRASYN